jgi:hypothetical protein
MTQLPGSPIAITGGHLYTYYMVNPAAGSNMVNLGAVSGCSWNVVETVFDNVNTGSPFGSITSNSGDSGTFVDAITTTSPYSIISDFVVYPNGPFAFSGLNGIQLFPSGASGCCDDLYGSYLATGAPGAYSMDYSEVNGADPWWAQTIELKAVTVCGSPTASPSVTPTFSASPSFSASPTVSQSPTSTRTSTTGMPPTATPSPTATCTQSATATVTPTATQSPTAYMTPCGATPLFVESSIVATGCAGNGNPTSFTYTIPAEPGEILLAQVESGGPVVSGVSYAGTAMTQVPGSPLAISGGGNIYSYYLVSPTSGSNLLNFNVSSGCSWNAVASVFYNINTSNPIGAVHSTSGSGMTFSDTITTLSPYSIVDDFVAYTNGPFPFSSYTGTPLFPAAGSGCCDAVVGSSMNTTAPGVYDLQYFETASPSAWTAQTLELNAACP